MNTYLTSPGLLIFIGGLILLSFICLLHAIEKAPLVDENEELPPVPDDYSAYDKALNAKIEAYFAQKRLEIQQDVLKAKMHKANAVVRSKLLPEL